MKALSAEAYADGERDALALIAALAADDWDAVKVLEAAGAFPAVLTAVLNFLFDELAGHGTDPAEWAEARQAELRARLAEGGA